jgi:hypothetical protein
MTVLGGNASVDVLARHDAHPRSGPQNVFLEADPDAGRPEVARERVSYHLALAGTARARGVADGEVAPAVPCSAPPGAQAPTRGTRTRASQLQVLVP